MHVSDCPMPELIPLHPQFVYSASGGRPKSVIDVVATALCRRAGRSNNARVPRLIGAATALVDSDAARYAIKIYAAATGFS